MTLWERRKPGTMQVDVIPAESGWRLLRPTPANGQATAFDSTPVVGWRVETIAPSPDSFASRAHPLIARGHIQEYVLQDPDGRLFVFGKPGFADEAAALAYINQQRQG